MQTALLEAVTIGFERTFRQDVALGLLQIVDAALLSMHVFDFYTAVQSTNELARLLSKLGRHPLGTETIFDPDGTVRVIIPGCRSRTTWSWPAARSGGAVPASPWFPRPRAHAA